MKESIYLAQKYAKAFDSCAKNTQEAQANFLCYQKALKNLVQIKDIVINPALSFNEKRPLLKEVLGQDIGACFLCLLIKEKRFSLAQIIEEQLLSLLDKRQGLVRAQITTAAALNTQEQAQVKKALKAYFNSELNLSFSQDKAILGGMIIKQEDLCIDGSILGRLENLKQALKR